MPPMSQREQRAYDDRRISAYNALRSLEKSTSEKNKRKALAQVTNVPKELLTEYGQHELLVFSLGVELTPDETKGQLVRISVWPAFTNESGVFRINSLGDNMKAMVEILKDSFYSQFATFFRNGLANDETTLTPTNPAKIDIHVNHIAGLYKEPYMAECWFRIEPASTDQARNRQSDFVIDLNLRDEINSKRVQNVHNAFLNAFSLDYRELCTLAALKQLPCSNKRAARSVACFVVNPPPANAL
jgi:hypothetical protein